MDLRGDQTRTSSGAEMGVVMRGSVYDRGPFPYFPGEPSFVRTECFWGSISFPFDDEVGCSVDMHDHGFISPADTDQPRIRESTTRSAPKLSPPHLS